MGRPKGSKNKPKAQKVAKVQKQRDPKPDKKINYTILNRALAAIGDLAADFSLAYREQARANAMNANNFMEVMINSQAKQDAATATTTPEPEKSEDSSGTKPQSGASEAESVQSAPSDLASIFGAAKDPVSK